MTPAEAPEYWMGFYGCSDRLVRLSTDKTEVGAMGHKRPKTALELDCPSCGYTHKVKIMWRAPIQPSEREKADLTL